jgi:hypothetical protein
VATVSLKTFSEHEGLCKSINSQTFLFPLSSPDFYAFCILGNGIMHTFCYIASTVLEMNSSGIRKGH